ncbi:hypothetical protein AMTRI_Chr12g271680 [Amborella trichopoda]|uniref:protein CWC15 homolog isoform X3 n=1 Tax=Amborella trichopoda TaxID=13333 RepID=UPI0009BDEAFF|nr:protein CWC15 homolog isoform X3 [Amborella trichopoda]|eukprot:XP_020520918.1 protein CWC15 homolog isoform X3 [Amborella trichopoda]
MTTAARPTWAPAKGGHEQGGTRIFGPSQKYSSRDLASHTTLKPRKDGQDTQEELQKRNLREELDDRERRHFTSKDKAYAEDRDRRKGGSGGHLLLEGRRDTEDRLVPRNVDADDSDVDAKSEDEDDDEDDTEALLAELERIKKERAEEKLRKERQKQEEELKAKEAELIRGNPLLNSTSFNVKRRWDDDVVFKNQTRGETKTPKRFINDTIRNDFHRKFLQKYMK